MHADLQAHYAHVAKAILSSRLVPLLGAGVNMCGRAPDVGWEAGAHLPSGSELAASLAKCFDYPAGSDVDLVRVTQYVTVMLGRGPLYEELHRLFDADYPPTAVHTLLAEMPGRLREYGRSAYQVIVTTNYDDALERAFIAAGEPFDVVSYLAEGEERGKFLHRPHDEEPRLIEVPNVYIDVPVDQRTVILKIHGAIDREDPDQDSYVITEDHYIDYLTRADISSLVPVGLGKKLKKAHFLFLGYSMRDWNLRVILHRIWGAQRLNFKSWAIQLNPEHIDQKLWSDRGVDILDLSLEDYVVGLGRQLDTLLASGPEP